MTRSASSGTTSESQMKFRTANSISSDQYFSDSQNGSSSGKSNLSRFEGSTSVSLADYFGRNESSAHGSGIRGQIQTPDLDDTDLKESVRQGITKVTGRISLLVNGVMSSIQVEKRQCSLCRGPPNREETAQTSPSDFLFPKDFNFPIQHDSNVRISLQ